MNPPGGWAFSCPTRRSPSDQPQPLATIAERVGVTAHTLRKHAERDGLPAPVVRCGKCANSYVYDAEAVRRYEECAPVDPSDRLVSLQEAADELELSYGSIRTYLGAHADFPESVRKIGRSRLWDREQVRAWRERRPGTQRQA